MFMKKNQLWITKYCIMLLFIIGAFFIGESNVHASNVWDGKTSEEFSSGSGTKDDPYKISTGKQLSYLAKGVDNGEEGKKGQYYELTADIDLGGHNWNPIGFCERKLSTFCGGNYFYGIFDGNGHKIKNLNIKQSNPELDNYYYGLFAWNCGTIQNLKVENATIDSDGAGYIGGISAVNEGNINHCSFDGTIKVSNNVVDVGGFVGRQIDGGSIDSCKNKAYIKATTEDCSYLGGIVGYNQNGKILNCVNEGTITGYDNIGGITGINDGHNPNEASIEKCINKGNIIGNYEVGGVAGENFRIATITNCKNIGSIKKSKTELEDIMKDSSYLGGIVGRNNEGKILNSVNEGDITGYHCIGGITGANVGYISNEARIEKCMNNGKVIGNYEVGGVAGENFRIASIINCENIGSIKGNDYSGGIVGIFSAIEKGKKEIKNCINIGNIDCDKHANGIVGQMDKQYEDDIQSLENCYYIRSDAIDGYWIAAWCNGIPQILEVKSLCTMEQLIQQNTYKNFDFDNDWKMSTYYPVIRGLDYDENLLKKPNVNGHSYKSWEYDETYHWKECTCGEKTEKEQHIEEIRNQKEATCTKEGYTGDTYCKECGKLIKKGNTIMAGHKFGDWQIVTEQSIFNKKSQKRTCSICGKEEIQTIGDKQRAKMSVNETSLKLKTKQSTKKLVVSGLAKGDYISSWISSDKKIVRVSGKSNGTCTIKAGSKTGQATITIILASGLKKTINVSVQKRSVSCLSIKNVSKKLTLNKKRTYQLTPMIDPITCTYKVIYKTSNKKIVKVTSKGKIKAVKKGKAKVTIVVGKKKFVCTVVVK